jgi:hypothetical protein
MKYLQWFKDLKKPYQIAIIILIIIGGMYLYGLF